MLPGNCAWNKRADDEGFTLVEILMASAILFFVATALFGLVATSTMLGVASKANAVSVNAVNAFLEEVRRVPFSEVNQTRVNQIAGAYSRTIDGIAVSISATVTPQWFSEQNTATASPAYLHVAVVARAVGPDGRPHTFRTGTNISNLRATGTLPGGGEPQVPPPTVVLRNDMPTTGAVRGTSVPVGLSAEAGGSGVTLRRIDITAGGALVLEKLTTELSDSVSGFWDTTRVTTDGASFPDGVYEMRASARDSRNQLTVRAWSLTVDNFPPNPPGQPVVDAVNSAANSVTFGWDPARDGTDWVRSYQVDWRMQSSTSSAFNMVGTPAVVTPVDWAARQGWTGTTSPLSRYRVGITSRGPIAEGQTTPHFTAGPVSVFFISRGSFAATVTVTNAGRTTPPQQASPAILSLDLTSSAPTFSTSSVNYRWQFRYHVDGATGEWLDLAGAGSSSPRFTDPTWDAPRNGSFTHSQINNRGWIEFRCLVTVTPAGGTTVQVPSSVVRFSRADNSVGPAARGVDNWARWENPPTVTPPAIDWGMWPQ